MSALLELGSTGRLRFRRSISGHHFQTTRNLANKDLQHYKEIIYSILQYIFYNKKKRVFFLHLGNFKLIYDPLSCLNNFLLGPIFMDFFLPFFKCLLNFRAHALQLELNKVGYNNFFKFGLQSMSSKIERALEKRTKYVFVFQHFLFYFFSYLNTLLYLCDEHHFYTLMTVIKVVKH